MASKNCPRRQCCNEECLIRIAARLCDLDECSRRINDGVDGDKCCKPGKKSENECSNDVQAKCPRNAESAKPKADCCSKQELEDGENNFAGDTCCSSSIPERKTNVVVYCSRKSYPSNVGVDKPLKTGCCSSSLQSTSKCKSSEDRGEAMEIQGTLKNPGKCCSFEKPGSGDKCCSSKPATVSPSTAVTMKSLEGEANQSCKTKSCCSSVPLPKPIQEETCEKECCETPATDGDAASSIDECVDDCCTAEVDVEPELPASACTKDFCETSVAKSHAASSISDECTDSCCNTKADVKADPQASACSDHLQMAMARYEATLKRGQCLCRRALRQLGFNCCTGSPVGPVSLSGPTDKAVTGLTVKKVLDTSTVKEIYPRCSYDIPKAPKKAKAFSVGNKQVLDIEQAAAREHVVLSVAGMTCTGCSRKMMNVLQPIQGLSNARVTFVSSSAEFDLDTATAKAENVLVRIEKETGFKCTRIISGRQELDVIMSAATAKQLEDANLDGVVSITKGKKTYRATYDPTIIGARSLLPQGAHLAPPSGAAGIADGKRRLVETAISTALAAALTIPVCVLEWSSNSVPDQTRGIVTLILGTCVQAIAIPEFYIGALKSLIYSHVIEMDMLVVISITAAYVYSVTAFGLKQAGIKLEQEAFFETSTLLITLVLLGRLIAAWARMRAVAAVSLRSLQAETALLRLPDSQTNKIDARLLQFGDIVEVPSHSRIVTDGQIISGASEVDESMVTGESLPVAKRPGDIVIAGTINGSGTLAVRLTRLPGENSITDIAKLVETAVASKPRVQELADKVASWFIPAVIGIATVVFCIWIAVGIQVRGRDGGGAVGLAITYAIAVLAISCPCALGLAVPMVLVIAGGVAARAGVIVKAADAVERGYQVNDVVFDKTGTLTEGDLQVVHAENHTLLPAIDTVEALSLAKAIVESSEHPVSVAVAAYIAKAYPTITKTSLDSIVSIPGGGIEAIYNGTLVKAGNPRWLKIEDHPAIVPLLPQAMTLFCLSLDNELILVYGLKSTLRPNAASIIAQLTNRGIVCHIVSGDNGGVVADVARTLNIPSSQVLAHSSPAGKQQYVSDLQSAGRKVLFLGDGTNDAVAIAQANVGIQMGSASDVTGAVADVVLLSHNIEGVIALLDLSRAAMRRVMFNFGWSAVYNLFAILLASGAFVDFRIPPAYAGLGEIVSVLPVIVAAGTLGLVGMKG